MPQTLLDGAEDRVRAPYTRCASDVFVLVKMFVSDCELSQPALLCFPGSEKAHLNRVLQDIGRSNVPCRDLRPRHSRLISLVLKP